MLTIRFSRVGKKKKPTYKIIVLEKEKDPWGNYLEQVGTYNPHTKETNLKTDRIKYFIANGAQPSESVNNLLVKEGVISGPKQKSVRISKKRAAKKAEKEKADKPQPKTDETKPEEETPIETKGEDTPKAEPKTETPKEEIKGEEVVETKSEEEVK